MIIIKIVNKRVQKWAKNGQVSDNHENDYLEDLILQSQSNLRLYLKFKLFLTNFLDARTDNLSIPVFRLASNSLVPRIQIETDS